MCFHLWDKDECELLIVNTIRSFFRMNNFDKPYKNYDELVGILKNKNLVIEDESKAKNLLQLHGFHHFINGYGKSFIKEKSDKFQSGTTLDDIYSLYLIDSEIQELFLTNVLKIEKNIANTIGNVVAEHFGVDNDKEFFDYLIEKEKEEKKKKKTNKELPEKSPKKLPEKFLKKDSYLYYKNYSKTRKNAAKPKEVISNIIRSANHTFDNPTYYYREKHNHIPPWILVQNLTFGQIVKYYEIQQPNLKTKIANEMISSSMEKEDIDQKKVLFNITALILSCFRNAAAHTSPLFLFKVEEHINHYLPPSKKTLEHYLGKEIFESISNDSLKTGSLYVALLSLLLLNRDSFQRRLLITKLQSLEQIWKEEPFLEDYKAYKEKAGLPDNYVDRLESAQKQLEKNEMAAHHPTNDFSVFKTVFVYTNNTFHLYGNCQYIVKKEIKEIKEISFLEATQKKYSLCKKCLAKRKAISK